MEQKSDKIIYLSYNLDGTCINIGTKNGFYIYNTDLFKLKFKKLDIGEIKIVEVLNKTNIVIFVGTINNFNYLPNKIIIWDDIAQEILGLKLFDNEIIKIRVKIDKIFILTKNQIHVLDTNSLEEIDSFKLNLNDICLFDISLNDINTVLIWTNNIQGIINIKSYNTNKIYDIKCHKDSIRCISINTAGTLIATASHRGTLIRIFDVSTGQLIQEVRRGSTYAIIKNITFSINSKYLCVTSDKDAIHIFEIKNSNKMNNISSLSFIGNLVPTTYFKSQWSFTKIYIEDKNYIITFGETDNNIIIITITGKYIKYELKEESKCINKIKNSKWYL